MRTSKYRQILWILALLFFSLASAIGYGHPGHEDALTIEKAKWRGTAIVNWLIETNQPVDGESLGKSWEDFDGETSCSATPVFYVVGLENRAVNKTLYLLLDHDARFLRARFDADFVQLKFSPFPQSECSRW